MRPVRRRVDRCHDYRRIFLRHSQRLTGNVFVDDQIADDAYAQVGKPADQIAGFGRIDVMPAEVI
jgi:hypothetical protein